MEDVLVNTGAGYNCCECPLEVVENSSSMALMNKSSACAGCNSSYCYSQQYHQPQKQASVDHQGDFITAGNAPSYSQQHHPHQHQMMEVRVPRRRMGLPNYNSVGRDIPCKKM
jgi:hypothetical protein